MARETRWAIEGIEPPGRVESDELWRAANLLHVPVTGKPVLPGVTHLLSAVAYDRPDADDVGPGGTLIAALAFDVVRRRRVEERVLLSPLSELVAYERPLKAGWHVAAMFFVGEDAELTLSEVKVFPGENRSTALQKPDQQTYIDDHSSAGLLKMGWILAGRWSQDSDAVASSPLSSTLLRDVKLAEIQTRVAYWTHACAQLLRPLPGARMHTLDTSVRRPGRAGRNDEHYAIWAARYVEAGGSLKAMEEKYGVSRSHIRDQIHAARRRGLLTGGGQQRTAGGLLTPKGEQALRGQEVKGDE